MSILTITVNPALDKSSTVEQVLPGKKLRCATPRYEPGGGGINVARAVREIGGEAVAWFLSGGPTGETVERLLKEENVEFTAFETENWTRENLMVLEKATGNQYRFGMPGINVSVDEWQAIIHALKDMDEKPEYLVASGSLPEGVPDDFYARIARIAKRHDIRLIVDTSGDALKETAGEGVYLLKPNLKELSVLAGRETINTLEQEDIAKQVIEEGKCEVLVVSLGPRGAMLATREEIQYVVPPTVKQQSAVGAGDCMVAGIVLSLIKGCDLLEVVSYGVAAGTAATMTPGSELCRRKDVEEIYAWLRSTRDKFPGSTR